jgi:hypothetical protein
MSFNNANIDTNTNNNWTTVSSGWSKNRSQQLINNSRSSSPNVPVLQTDSPITAEMSFPVTSSSPVITFINEPKSTQPITYSLQSSQQSINAPVPITPVPGSVTVPVLEATTSVLEATTPVLKATTPVLAVPTLSESTKPMGVIPIAHTPTSAFNTPNSHFNNWENTLENLKIQYELIKHNIKLIEYEMRFPPSLRGRTPEEKDQIISKTVYDITVEHLAKIKPVLINYKKWVDTIKPTKITGMILENCTLKEKCDRASNKEEVCKLVTEACDVLYEAFTSSTQKANPFSTAKPSSTAKPFSTAKPSPPTKKEITITEEPSIFASVASIAPIASIAPVACAIKEKHDVTFTFEQRTEHKAALHAAQEKFYDMCKPNEEEANDLKEKIKPLSDWEDCIKRINVSDDAIVIDDKYTFSKKHFLNNTWFLKRMKKDYGKMYEMNIRIHMDKTFLVITGKKCEFTQ